jgi:hypothetical protein
MNKREILELFTQQQRIELDSPGTKREVDRRRDPSHRREIRLHRLLQAE